MSGQTPIFTALITFMQENGLRLHMPGHGGVNNLFPPELNILAGLDYTEIPGLDDLHMAEGIIAQAQQMLARACGAERSFFLLNGATSGIHALLMSCRKDAQVILPRNAHRAFYGGLVLSGAIPHYIPCEIFPELGVALSISPKQVEKQLHLHPDAEVVFITSPSYYGTCSDIASIVKVAQCHGQALMVDEAHGAHFPFHTLYPASALQAGAAAAVNGLHKTWPVLTQGACLHLGKSFNHDMLDKSTPGDDIWDRGDHSPNSFNSGRYNRLQTAYHLLTTTSPSYPLMANIDWARDFMERYGEVYLEQARQLSKEYKARLNTIKGIHCYGEELTDLPGINATDPLKVLIGTGGLNLDGHQLGRILREEYNIGVEMTDQNMILAMFSLLHERAAWEQFYQALLNIAARYPTTGKKSRQAEMMPAWQMVISPRQAFFAGKSRVSLADCRGKVAGEMVAAYPPGIPCLIPGELITDQVWEYLGYLQRSGIHIQGPEDPRLEHINIID